MKKIICLATMLLGINLIWAQEESTGIAKDTINLDEVLVKATRVDEQAPFTQSNMNKKEIERRNLGQDVPYLLNFLPSVVTTSDAGAGIGYTGIRVRGSDATRVNVTINGIPYNDSESHGTFWVDLPDFASSTQSIQLQRGVGASTNGAGAFGASLSLSTNGVANEAFAEIGSSVGSFNTYKINTQFSTGLIERGDVGMEFAGRVSRIESDGYIDRASSDLKSLFFSASFITDRTLVKAIMFGGYEVTYQAWDGIDKQTLETDRKYNPSGEIYDDNGNLTGYYKNQIDDYKQDHYQLHINHQFDNDWVGNFALHYTYGRGFYESYKNDEDLVEYGLDPVYVNGDLKESSDLVRRKWLDNDFFGTTFSLIKQYDQLNLTFGGAWNKYIGDHYGEVIWAKYGAQEPFDKYYDNTGTKTDFNVFAKAEYELNEQWQLFGDLQYRMVDYKIEGIDEGPVVRDVKDDHNFINPKAGVSYFLNNSQFYFSYARGHKEPKRSDYENDEKPKPEALNDFELGWKYQSNNLAISANAYYMHYTDQLVLTGAIDDVGNPIAENIGKSYRLGIEIDAVLKFAKQFTWQPNLALSQNKNVDKQYVWNGVLTDYGNTDLSFSPSVVAGSRLTWEPIKNLDLSLLSKFVGEQYMSNIEHQDSKLDSYFVNDINLSYEFSPKHIFKSIVVTGMVNNIFNVEYVSNGYFGTWDDDWTDPNQVTTYTYAGYYPQATVNFLLGLNLRF